MIGKTKLLLLGIIFFAAVLRLWGLGTIPPSPDWDEAALGYNAYSIMHTGRDEYGKQFPIILRSFGDYKPALYVYLTIPSIAVFGLDTFAVRLPSAIFGILTVFGTFLLVKELLQINNKSQIENSKHLLEIGNWKLEIPIIAAALLAISPWHIQFSRVAFETNIGVTFSVFAAVFFLYGLRKNIFLIFSAVCLALSLYSYQSEKLFVPLFALVLIGIFFKELKQVKRSFLIGAVLVGFVVALPMGISLLRDSTTLARAKNVSIFNQQSDDYNRNAEKLVYDHQTHDVVGLILDNRRVLFVRQMIGNYLSHFDLNWLFITGDISRHHAPDMGLLYQVELPLLFIGLYFLLFGAYPRKMKLLLFLWLLIAPLPAAITQDVPHAVRVFHMVPSIIIIVAVGLYESVLFIRRTPMKNKRIATSAAFALIGIVYLFNIGYYLNQYFVQLPYFTSEDWQYGYKAAVAKTNELAPSYDTIVVSDKVSLDQSYIFYLFYLKFPPAEYQKNMQFINNNETDRRIGKYEFRQIYWPTDKNLKNTLFIGMPGEFPSDYPKKDEIYFLDGKPAIEIVGT